MSKEAKKAVLGRRVRRQHANSERWCDNCARGLRTKTERKRGLCETCYHSLEAFLREMRERGSSTR